MPDTVWYYHHAGTRSGPVSLEQLRQVAAAGELEPGDLVWQQGTPDWVLARTVEGLFGAEPTPLPPPPTASAEPADRAPAAVAPEVDAKAREAATPAPPPAPAAPSAPRPVLRPDRPRPAAVPHHGGASPRKARAVKEAQGFLDMLPHVRFIDGLLDWLRELITEEVLAETDRLAKTAGHVAYVGCAALAVVCTCVLAIKADDLKLFLAALLVIPAAILLHYTAVAFLDSGKTLIEKSPSAISTTGFLRVYSLFQLGSALALMLLAIFTAIRANKFLPLGVQILSSVAALYVVGLALRPSAVNVKVGGEVSAGEEAIGILAFLAKTWLRLTPLLYGVGAVVGMCGLVYLLVILFIKEPWQLLMLSLPILGLALGIALVPFVFYLVFLLVYLGIDVLRSVLVVPGKLDAVVVAVGRASAARDETPAGGKDAEDED